MRAVRITHFGETIIPLSDDAEVREGHYLSVYNDESFERQYLDWLIGQAEEVGGGDGGDEQELIEFDENAFNDYFLKYVERQIERNLEFYKKNNWTFDEEGYRNNPSLKRDAYNNFFENRLQGIPVNKSYLDVALKAFARLTELEKRQFWSETALSILTGIFPDE